MITSTFSRRLGFRLHASQWCLHFPCLCFAAGSRDCNFGLFVFFSCYRGLIPCPTFFYFLVGFRQKASKLVSLAQRKARCLSQMIVNHMKHLCVDCCPTAFELSIKWVLKKTPSSHTYCRGVGVLQPKTALPEVQMSPPFPQGIIVSGPSKKVFVSFLLAGDTHQHHPLGISHTSPVLGL